MSGGRPRPGRCGGSGGRCRATICEWPTSAGRGCRGGAGSRRARGRAGRPGTAPDVVTVVENGLHDRGPTRRAGRAPRRAGAPARRRPARTPRGPATRRVAAQGCRLTPARPGRRSPGAAGPATGVRPQPPAEPGPARPAAAWGGPGQQPTWGQPVATGRLVRPTAGLGRTGLGALGQASCRCARSGSASCWTARWTWCGGYPRPTLGLSAVVAVVGTVLGLLLLPLLPADLLLVGTATSRTSPAARRAPPSSAGSGLC